MKNITQSEALEALKQVSRNDRETFSIEGKPDHLLSSVSVFFVRVWDGENVDWHDVMFKRTKGKVSVYG